MQRVLIVDDEPLSREFLRELFEGEEWWVVEAADGQEALEALVSPGMDVGVVITDNCMPRMTGPALIEAMREHDGLKRIPVILMTGDDSLDDKPLQLAKERVRGFLLKPFHLREMMATVRRVIAGRTA